MVSIGTACAVCAGWVRQEKDQRNVVAWVRQQGGYVRYESTRKFSGQEAFDLHAYVPTWLASQLGRDFFSRVRTVSLAETKVKDLTPLTRLAGLEDLHIDDTQLRDLSPLRQCSDLRFLGMSSTPVTDISPLSELQELRELNLGYTDISDLAPLENSSNLSSLDLYGSGVKDLSPLRRLTALYSVGLDKAQASGNNLKYLSELPHLSRVIVSGIYPQDTMQRIEALRSAP